MIDDSAGAPPELAEVLETLQERLESRRIQGIYPPGLEADLDRHFAHLTDERSVSSAIVLDQLDEALVELRQFGFDRERISTESRVPGGRVLHRAIAKSVARQIQGVLEQVQEQSRQVAHALTLTAQVTGMLADPLDTRVLQQLDDLQLRLAEEHRQLQGLLTQVGEVAARVPGVAVDAWYSPHAFTAHFRGGQDDIRDRYRDLAAKLVGCDPVLDIGFGRGEFLALLRELDVEAFGIEADPQLVTSARAHGLHAEVGTAVESLRNVADASLGGVVMIQVIEHLAPQHVIDVVKLMADKVRSGGRVIVETVNPTSLFTYAHAFWVDPDHVRPVHPTYLGFLFAEAGFANVERIDRSPVPADESLELLDGDDELSKRLNANFERINALLFGPQDYAIVATR